YALDCLIYAAGFEVGTDYTRRAGYEVHGRSGMTLTEKWRDGATTFHGFHSRDFPNCFIVSIVQSGFSVNFPNMLDKQARHLAHTVPHPPTTASRASRRASGQRTTGCRPSSTSPG